MAAKGGEKDALKKEKTRRCSPAVYPHARRLQFGEPPTEFTWTRKERLTANRWKRRSSLRSLSIRLTSVPTLKNNFPHVYERPFTSIPQTYTIDLDRHSYDGAQWTCLSLQMDGMEAMAAASIKDFDDDVYVWC